MDNRDKSRWCSGCLVRPPFEHRCHDESLCPCDECKPKPPDPLEMGPSDDAVQQVYELLYMDSQGRGVRFELVSKEFKDRLKASLQPAFLAGQAVGSDALLHRIEAAVAAERKACAAVARENDCNNKMRCGQVIAKRIESRGGTSNEQG